MNLLFWIAHEIHLQLAEAVRGLRVVAAFGVLQLDPAQSGIDAALLFGGLTLLLPELLASQASPSKAVSSHRTPNNGSADLLITKPQPPSG